MLNGTPSPGFRSHIDFLKLLFLWQTELSPAACPLPALWHPEEEETRIGLSKSSTPYSLLPPCQRAEKTQNQKGQKHHVLFGGLEKQNGHCSIPTQIASRAISPASKLVRTTVVPHWLECLVHKPPLTNGLLPLFGQQNTSN